MLGNTPAEPWTLGMGSGTATTNHRHPIGGEGMREGDRVGLRA